LFGLGPGQVTKAAVVRSPGPHNGFFEVGDIGFNAP
jgi:hypothetical protein